jgi:hypothetical protein
MKTVKFKSWDCIVQKGHYSNGRVALQLINAVDNSPIAKATINIPEIALSDDQVIIKDYAENEGMLQALFQADIITPPIAYIEAPYTKYHICILLNLD